MTHKVRRICYVSGTRADFGLMQSTLRAISASPKLALDVVVTGMHLSERFGMTVREIEAAGLNVAARIPVNIDESTGAAMARNMGMALTGCVDAFEQLKPDIVLLLGDRGEMLAGALAAIHLTIPIAHIHGGERSGTVDEPVRHAISKLSHYHLVASQDAHDRLVKMGERRDCIFITGAPGLDGLEALAMHDRAVLCKKANFDPCGKLALFVYHPVLQEAGVAADEAQATLEACLDQGFQTVAMMPNSDAGSATVREVLAKYADHLQVRVETHLHRTEYVSWMAACDVMIGNSSSGIIEAASFGTPVLNVGTRQNLRLRNQNIMDIHNVAEVGSALSVLYSQGRHERINVYGDGHATDRIVALLERCDITSEILNKLNSY